MSSSEVEESCENARKKIKLSVEEDFVSSDPVAEDLSAYTRINSFADFKLKHILSDNKDSKSIFVEGIFEPTSDPAIILLEKSTFDKNSVEKLLNTADLALNLKSNTNAEPNVVDYACFPKVDQGDMVATVICPSTPKHSEKYRYQPMFVVNETPEAYKAVVLPHIESQKFSLQWVYNILEHKSEVERIVYEDPDKDLGFILVPDLKWNDTKTNSIYLIAICHNKNLKSLRDLNESHLSLLNNIKTKGLDIISKKYKIPSEKMRVYFHYQPSYYHLHVHFTSIEMSVPGDQFEKAHLLDTVISNIELSASYYQNITLTYLLKENDPLLNKLRNAGLIELDSIKK